MRPDSPWNKKVPIEELKKKALTIVAPYLSNRIWYEQNVRSFWYGSCIAIAIQNACRATESYDALCTWSLDPSRPRPRIVTVKIGKKKNVRKNKNELGIPSFLTDAHGDLFSKWQKLLMDNFFEDPESTLFKRRAEGLKKWWRSHITYNGARINSHNVRYSTLSDMQKNGEKVETMAARLRDNLDSVKDYLDQARAKELRDQEDKSMMDLLGTMQQKS